MSDSVSSRKPVLVTGGSGFLGRAVVAELRRGGHAMRSFQRGSAADSDAGDIAGDVRDPAAVTRAVEGVDSVIHAAGLAHVFADAHLAPFAEINEVGTDVVARCAASAGVRHLILVSSVAVYGDGRAGGDEDSPCRPVGPYAASKAAAEARAVAVAESAGMRLTILRLATLYGEGDRGNVQRLLKLVAGGRFVWIGTGANRKTLIHVEDAARACVLPLTTEGAPLETYNVAAAPVPMRAVVDGLARALGRHVPRWHVPAGLAVSAAASAGILLPARGRAVKEALSKWMSDDVYPADRFTRRYGFDASVQLEEGLARQVAWWRSQSCMPGS